MNEAQFEAMLILTAAANDPALLTYGIDETAKAVMEAIFVQSSRHAARMKGEEIEVVMRMSEDQHTIYLHLCEMNEAQVRASIDRERGALKEESAEFDHIWQHWELERPKDLRGQVSNDLSRVDLLIVWNAFSYALRGKHQQHSGSVKRVKHQLQHKWFQASDSSGAPVVYLRRIGIVVALVAVYF